MKWLSLKKFIPLKGTEYFITDCEFIYTGTYTPSGEWIDGSLDVPIADITHFAMPEPIEIED